MKSPVKINEELTFAKFGYKTSDLNSGSHNKICVECQSCERSIIREFRDVNRFHICPVIEGSNKRCFNCKEWKDLSLFNKNPKGSGGVSKLCRECYNNHSSVKKSEYNRSVRIKKSLLEDLDYYLRIRSYALKNKAKKNSIEFDLDFNFLKALWVEQNGVCYYTNIKLVGKGKPNKFQAWNSPSLDRLNPNFGYVKGNVVWCANCVNSFKGSLNEIEFKEIIKNIKWNL